MLCWFSSPKRRLTRDECFKNFSQHLLTHRSSSFSSVFLLKLWTHVEKHFSTRLLYMRRLSRVCMPSIIAAIFFSSSGDGVRPARPAAGSIVYLEVLGFVRMSLSAIAQRRDSSLDTYAARLGTIDRRPQP
jgi:hypothetical protein